MYLWHIYLSPRNNGSWLSFQLFVSCHGTASKEARHGNILKPKQTWQAYCDMVARCNVCYIIQGVQEVTQPMEKCNILFLLYFMPISYNKCWKCPPLRSTQRCTRRIMLANTFCNVPVDILSTVRWMLAWSSCSVCVDDLNTQYPWDAPIKRSQGGLSPVIVEATISLK
jgi:hypothetical protein